MKRGATPTVSLMLVGVFLLALSGPAAASATSGSGISHGRRMFQEPDQLPTEAESKKESPESTQQSSLAASTDTSSILVNSSADPTPGASEANATRSEGAEAAGSKPKTVTLGSDAEEDADKTSAQEGSGLTSANRHQHASNNSMLQHGGLSAFEPEEPSGSAHSLHHEDNGTASSIVGQATASQDADQPHANKLEQIVAEDSQGSNLTFDEALAQTALGAELSDGTPSNTSSSSDDLTFDQALAATNGTQGIKDVIGNSAHSIASHLKPTNPQGMSPVLESLLPSTESLNGSLHAALQESDGASNASAAHSLGESSLIATNWTGLAHATATATDALKKTVNASTSLLDQDVLTNPSDSSILNATQDAVAGAASSAAGALATASSAVGNATAALAATANTTAVNVTNTPVTAGGAESDTLLGNGVVNASVADGVLHSGADKVAGVVSGVKSWLNSSKANDHKEGLQGLDTGSRAAAAELGTEDDALAAQTGSKSSQSASKQQLPYPLEYEGGLELDDMHNDASADRASNITGMLSSAGGARPAATQAGDHSGTASLTGTNSSTGAVVAAALANPKGSASKAASLAGQRATEQDEAERRVSQQAAAGSHNQLKGTPGATKSTTGTDAAAAAKSVLYGDDQLSTRGGIGSHKAEDEHSLPLSQHTRSGSATGADSAARAGSTALPSVKPISLQASHTLTPAQQRELERESAYQASTGSTAGTLTDSSAAASGKSKASLPSWGDIAGQTNPGAATGDPTSGKGAQSSGSVGSHTAAELDQDSSSTVKQQSLGDSESDADMEDYDPRAFATGSTDSFSHPADPTGQVWDPRTAGASSESRVRPSMGGEEEYGQEGDSRHFMVNRDPADPRSVVRAQQDRAQAGQHHGAGVGAGGTGGGLAVGKTKMSLVDDDDEESAHLASSQASRQSASKSEYASDDELAGPVVKGVGEDNLVSQTQMSSKQTANGRGTLHGLLDNVINNWVVITALSALAGTGAVLGFVFLRGFVPNPYDAITISNSGNGRYAGNNGYHGVSREDEENGWEGWADDDVDITSQVKQSSNGNSPPRGTGVGKLKKGTFAKKKPANWSNDF